MNRTAIEMFSTLGVGVLCIVLGVIALAIFFTVLSRIDSGGAKPDTMSIRGVLKKNINSWRTQEEHLGNRSHVWFGHIRSRAIRGVYEYGQHEDALAV